MKNTNKKTLKILAGVIAVILIGGILFVTNSFVGNPISAMMANKAIEEYVDQNYSYLDLEIEKTIYNFKYGAYMAKAKSRTSIDTKFAIFYKNGNVYRDNYENHVLSMFNTLDRLSDEYSIVTKKIIANELGYEDNTTIVQYIKDEYESAEDILELDMKFDRTLPLKAEVNIRLDLKRNSLENITKVLTDAHKAFVDNDCNFQNYGLYAENNGMLVMVNDVTPDDIESGELLSRLKEAKNNDKVGGVRVFIKGENK